jgi:hypothetical protein
VLFHHIAEMNKTNFDKATYQQFVKEDKKVSAKNNRCI